MVNCVNYTGSDPFYTETEVAVLAAKIDVSSASFSNFSNRIVSLVWDCVEAGVGQRVGSSMNCEILKQFHKLRCGSEVVAEWESFLRCQEITASKRETLALLQFLLRHLLEDILKLACHSDVHLDEVDNTLSVEEEGVLRYVAGFIPFALVKRYSRVKSTLGKKYTDILLSWKLEEDENTEADSFLAYTSVWMTYQNRGGLFNVSDKVYTFFRSMEFVVKKNLAMNKLVGESTSARDTLEAAVRSSSGVEIEWEKLTINYFTRDESEDLLTTIMNYYIKIRLTSFVKLYVNLRRRENAKRSRKGAKGLRKELKKSSKSK